VNVTVIWDFLLGACALIHTFVWEGQPAVIVMRMLDVTVHDLGIHQFRISDTVLHEMC
jgi:hypothetical protein